MKQTIVQLKEQLGWQGIAGVILLALAGLFQMLTLQPLEDETAFMHRKVDAARAKTSLQGKTFSSPDRQRELAAFFESLPAEKDVTDILARIYTVAEASRVELKQAEYHLDEKTGSHLEYAMVFPVQGEYANIRFFVFRVLADHPALALDQINFQRDRINDSMLKAEVRLTLFLLPTSAKN